MVRTNRNTLERTNPEEPHHEGRIVNAFRGGLTPLARRCRVPIILHRTVKRRTFEDFRWETPPITIASAGQPFEFVLVDDPGLAQVPDAEAFSEHFDKATKNPGVVSFSNLGKDALLVVPCPLGSATNYRHIAVFLREAPEQQKHSFWKAVADTTPEALGPRPVWLSTAGSGVSWLHVRIDRRPKYYAYLPYRSFPAK